MSWESKLQNADAGKLVLRLTLGILMLFHGVAKLVHGVGGIQNMLAGQGLPEFLAFGVFLGEVVGPLLVIAGYQLRIGALLIIINMLFAIGLAHMGEIFALSSHGGWKIELQAFYLFTAVAVLFLGPGKYAFRK
jgi:putative oxidoreductase